MKSLTTRGLDLLQWMNSQGMQTSEQFQRLGTAVITGDNDTLKAFLRNPAYPGCDDVATAKDSLQNVLWTAFSNVHDEDNDCASASAEAWLKAISNGIRAGLDGHAIVCKKTPMTDVANAIVELVIAMIEERK